MGLLAHCGLWVCMSECVCRFVYVYVCTENTSIGIEIVGAQLANRTSIADG